MTLTRDQYSEAIRYTETGTYTKTPRETVENILKHRTQIGIQKVEKINPEITYNIPIYIINQPQKKPRCHREKIELNRQGTIPGTSYGKGLTDEQSKASALMENLERHSAQIRQQLFNESETKHEHIDKKQFTTPKLIPPKCWYCQERGVNCYNTLDSFNKWIKGHSLTQDKPVIVPAAVTFYPYIEKEKSYLYNDTGGLASGNTLKEAIRNGVAEIIERDALYHAYNQEKILEMQQITGIKDSETINSFYNRSLPEDKIISFKIENPTLKTRSTTISSMAVLGRGERLQVFGGSGTHPSPQVAMIRALTELVQQKIRKGVHKKISSTKFHTWSTSGAEIPDSNKYKFIEEELRLLLGDLKKAGHEVIYVNLTDKRIGIPVVRVLIPGLVNYGVPFKYSFLKKIIEKRATQA